MRSLDPTTDLHFIRLAHPHEWPASVLLASGQQAPHQRPQEPSAPAEDNSLAARVERAKAGLYGSRTETQQRAREVREAMKESGRQ